MLLSDERLTRRAIGGDEDAFTAIFERYQEPLYRYCLAILGDREDAEDALQGTMVKVLRALPGEERRIELKPWLYRIAHNEAIELIRRRRPSEELDAELLAGGAGPAEEASQRQRLRQLLADLEQLPESQRGALVMRELGGLGFEEIGAALGSSAAVARQTLYEARLGLREMDAGREMACAEVMHAISDGDGRVLRRRDIRAHLRGCESCRRFREEIDGRERELAALAPLPAAVAAGLLQGILGGSGGAAGGAGAGAAVGAGAAKTVGASVLLKGAATVAVVAAIGVTAADKGGLVHLGLPGDGGSKSQSAAPAEPGTGAAPASAAQNPAGAAPAGTTNDDGGSARLGGATKAGGNSTGAGGQRHAAATTPAQAGEPEAGSPPSSSHGRETSASHKASGNGSSQAKGSHPAKPAHPTHPAKPAHPSHPEKLPHPAKPEHPAKPGAAASPAAETDAAEAEPQEKPKAPDANPQGTKSRP